MDLGRRLIFINGKLVVNLGEMTGSITPREPVASVHVVDLEFGEYATEFANCRDVEYDGEKLIFLPLDESANPLSYEEQLEYIILTEGGYI